MTAPGPGVIFVTPEPLGARMAGPAIRALELARALARDGRCGPVRLVSLTAADLVDGRVAVYAATDEPTLRGLVADAATVVVQGDVLGLHPWLVDSPVVLVVDAYDPYHLEQLEQSRPLGEPARRAVVRDCVRSLSAQFTRADLVLCASDRQRALWTGHLAALGRVNPVTYDEAPDLTGLLRVVPFGVSGAQVPDRDRGVITGIFPTVGEDDVVLLWGGGVYPWFDAELLVAAMARLAGTHPTARLVFLGTQHPVPGVATAAGAAREAAARSGTLGRTVFFHEGWVPYDERGAWLAAADVGVSTHRAHVETEFAFRTRLLDCLWAGLPVVGTGGDDLSESIAARGAGATVPAGDLEALVVALTRAVEDRGWRESAGAAARALGAVSTWDDVAVPLADFCAAPRRAPDLLLDPTDRLQLGLGAAVARSASPLVRVRAALREGGLQLVLRRVRGRLPGPRR